MKYNVIVIEDDAILTETLKGLINEEAQLTLAGSFTNVADALVCVENNEVDLIFLDITLEESNGFDFLRKSGTRAEIIVMSADKSNAAEAYDLDVQQFLTKPFTGDTFKAVVEKAVKHIAARGELAKADHIYVKVDHGYRRLDYKDIALVEGQRDYVLFHLTEGRCLVRAKMKDVEQALANHPQFFRCHRSYIINMDAVTFFSGQEVQIGNRVIPVSAGNYGPMQQLINVL